MGTDFAGSAWKEYALTGRPDFLNYLHAGDVSWNDLWRFYQETPADTGAVVKLIRLFHLFLCRDFELTGSLLDRDSAEYQALRNWAAFAVTCREVLPEGVLCESLSELLASSMVSPLYYEAVFSVYLETWLEHQVRAGMPETEASSRMQSVDLRQLCAGRLRYRLPDLPGSQNGSGALFPVGHADRYAAWDNAYSRALGEELEGWDDEGGEG